MSMQYDIQLILSSMTITTPCMRVCEYNTSNTSKGKPSVEHTWQIAMVSLPILVHEKQELFDWVQRCYRLLGLLEMYASQLATARRSIGEL